MTEQNSFLVDFDLVSVRDGEYLHGAGARWAAPRVEHAASQMREVFDNRQLASQRAELGKAFVRANHSAEAISKALLSRLEDIELLPGFSRSLSRQEDVVSRPKPVK